MAYHLAPQAEADLEELTFYILLDSGSLETADRLINAITERFDLLAAHPRAGRRRDDLRRGLRSFPVHGFLILYRIDDDVYTTDLRTEGPCALCQRRRRGILAMPPIASS